MFTKSLRRTWRLRPKLNSRSFAIDKNELLSLIVDVPDFPKKGILFKDITPLLAKAGAFSKLVDELCKLIPNGTNKVIAVESRGFILGAAVAARMHLGLVIARKPGKLPRTKVSYKYDLEYGTDTLELHADDVGSQDKVVIVDDVLATGGTAGAAEKLCDQATAKILGHLFLIELKALEGRKKLKAPVASYFSI